MAALQLGVVFPTGDLVDAVAIRDFAQAADDLGYEYLVAYDHVLGASHDARDPRLDGPYTEHDRFHEPLTLFAYLSGVTRSIRFVTGVLVLPQRQTALVAKQAAEVALLSGNRLTLGVGTGWNHVEYEALSMPFRERGARLDEQVDVLRALWSQDLVDVDGRFHRIDRAGIAPRPATMIPIWFGGTSPVALRRAVRLGDGMLFPFTGRRTCELARETRELAADVGRSPLDLAAIVDVGKGAESWLHEGEDWSAVGGSALVVRTTPIARSGPTPRRSAREHQDAIEGFAQVMQ